MSSVDLLGLLERDGAREAVLEVLVRMALVDGEVHDEEVLLLQQYFPRESAPLLKERVESIRGQPLDAAALQRAVPAVEDRLRLMKFAARMAWTDRQVTADELALLAELSAGLGLDQGAVERALNDTVGVATGKITPKKVAEAIAGMPWGPLAFSPEPPRSGLARRLPADARVFGVVSLRGMEQAILADKGFVAGFREGDAWIPWDDVQLWSRVAVFGAAVRVDLRDGRRFHLGAIELWPFSNLLDRICC
jgi:hypothetical protein